MKLQTRLANMLIAKREDTFNHKPANVSQIDKAFDYLNQWDLGTFSHNDKKPRTRKQIYTMWELMQTDPQVAEALSLHVTASLGGHESTGEVIFISPHERVRGDGRRANELRKKVEREARTIAPLINRHAYALARQAIGYGDSYARIYSDKRLGVLDILNDRSTLPPMIMAFEQAGWTVGFHVLEEETAERSIIKLTPQQLLRVKMPRAEYVPQHLYEVWVDSKKLAHDIRSESPILPSEVGGSFLYPVEEVWKDVTISRAGLNNQQIADSVKQAFLTINMEGMPAVQRKGYRKALSTMLTNYREQIQNAFNGGEALYGTKYHVLPQWGEKQILQTVGDLAQRTTPLNSETLMINLRRLAGGLGIDLSMIGWADMLAGGLGDGAMFHTSAQIMRRSRLIRQALIDAFDHLMSLHWGLKYGEYFKSNEYPWQFDFYSDQSASATEALANKQNRANTMAIMTQSMMGLRELGLDKETNQLLLEDIFGADLEMAERIAESLVKKADEDMAGSMGMPSIGGDMADISENDDAGEMP